MRCLPIRWPLVAGGHQASLIISAPGAQHQRNGRKNPINESPGAQNPLNERTPGAAIAIGKGMNGLQLRVSESRLCRRWHSIPFAKQDEVVHQGRHALRERRNKGGRTRMIGTFGCPGSGG